jgi:MFS family permease
MLNTYWQRLRGMQRNARLFLLSNGIANVATGAVALLYAVFLRKLGYSTEFLSLLLVLGIVGAGVGLIPALFIARYVSARQLLIWSNVIGGIAVAFHLLFPLPWILMTTSFLAGASISIYTVLSAPILSITSSEVERAHVFSINAVLGQVTGVLGSLIGGFLPALVVAPILFHSPLVTALRPILVHGNALPLQLAILVSAALALPCIWPLILMDGRTLKLDDPRPATPRDPRPWQARLGELVRRETVQRALAWPATRYAAYSGLLGFGAGLFLTYLNLYFIEHLGVSTQGYGIISAASTILLAVATLGAPILAERMGSVRGPISAQFFAVPLLMAMAVFTSVPIVAALFLLRTTFMNLGQPALQSFIMGALPVRERSAANMVFTVAYQAPFAIGGVLSGILIAHIGFTGDFILAAISYLLAMLLMVPWFGRERTMLHAVTSEIAHPVAEE